MALEYFEEDYQNRLKELKSLPDMKMRFGEYEEASRTALKLYIRLDKLAGAAKKGDTVEFKEVMNSVNAITKEDYGKTELEQPRIKEILEKLGIELVNKLVEDIKK